MVETRKLATILALDVAGYSRAAERDDAAAALAVRQLRGVITDVCAPFGGRIFSAAGDGFMVEFPAAASGVQAAMALLTEAGSGARSLPNIRIGLHLGDVIMEENGDLLGHGVNVAARLQALAEPGTAMASETVWQQVRSGAQLPFRSRGRVQLDKMDQRIGVYSLDPGKTHRVGRIGRRKLVRAAALALGLVAILAAAFWPRTSQTAPPPATLKASIAVLPFANLSGDPEKDYLARGVAVEIIDKLAQLDGIEVISRNSSFTFGADADPRTVGSDLKVAHVLTGTVREENGRISITAELVDAERGTAIWTQPYEGDFTADGVDAVQRQIAAKVSGAMSIAFNVDKGARPSGSGTQSLAAYDFYLRGLDAWWYNFNRDLAEDLFARAVELDPDYADAWAGLAITTASKWQTLPPAEARKNFDEAYEMARRAVDLDPNLSVAQSVFGAISTTRKEWDAAEAATLQALRISRSEMALNNRQMLLLRTGRLNDAYASLLELEQVDPLRGPDDLALLQVLSAIGRHAELRDIMSRPDWAESSNTDVGRSVDVVTERINAGDPSLSVRRSLEAISRSQEAAPATFARELLAAFDDRAKARAVLRATYEDQNFRDPIKWDLIPILAAWYGDTDLVLRVWRDELTITTPRTAFIWGPAFSAARAT